MNCLGQIRLAMTGVETVGPANRRENRQERKTILQKTSARYNESVRGSKGEAVIYALGLTDGRRECDGVVLRGSANHGREALVGRLVKAMECQGLHDTVSMIGITEKPSYSMQRTVL